jgi:hypothetical protein
MEQKLDADGKPIVEKPVVTFSTEQQDFINKTFDTRFATIKAKHEAEVKRLADELAAKGAVKTEAELEAERLEAEKNKGKDKDQYKALIDAEKAKAEKFRLQAEQAEKKAKDSEGDVLKVRKEVAIAKAAQKQNFFELDVVMKMTQDNIVWDDDSKGFVIMENGVVKENSSLKPMTLDEYFGSFAAQRPYLVNGNVKGGAGSTESATASLGLVKTKADLKTAKDKSDFITKFGLAKYETLPLK